MVERFTASRGDVLCDVGSLSGWRQRDWSVSLAEMGLVGVVAVTLLVVEATELH